MSVDGSIPHHDHPHPHLHQNLHQYPREHPDRVHAHVAGSVDRRTLIRSGAVGLGAMLLAACGSTNSDSGGTPSATASADTAPTADPAASSTGPATSDSVAASDAVGGEMLPGFDAFADTVTAFSDGDWWLVESNGLPAHQMMVGITSWQQQVPVLQAYTGTNAWKIPHAPVLADEPVSGENRIVPRCHRIGRQRGADLQCAEQPR